MKFLLLALLVLSSACVSETVASDPIITRAEALSTIVSGRTYRTDSQRSKSAGSITWSWSDAGGHFYNQPTQADGAFATSRELWPFGYDFPSPCSFTMQPYDFFYSTPPVTDIPGSVRGSQRIYGNRAGWCTCNGLARTLPAGSIFWYPTNSATGYWIEKANFSMCGFTWQLKGAVYQE